MMEERRMREKEENEEWKGRKDKRKEGTVENE